MTRHEDEDEDEEAAENDNRQRRRTFSLPLSRPATATSKSTSKSKGKGKGRGKGKGKGGVVEMDETGIMLVDGVEFVNVISLKARVDRADSGLGLGLTDGVAVGHQ